MATDASTTSETAESSDTSVHVEAAEAGLATTGEGDVVVDAADAAVLTSPSATISSADASSSTSTGRLALVGLVAAILGVTWPLALFLGKRARNRADGTLECRAPFAVAAVMVSYCYAALTALLVLTYLVIR